MQYGLRQSVGLYYTVHAQRTLAVAVDVAFAGNSTGLVDVRFVKLCSRNTAWLAIACLLTTRALKSVPPEKCIGAERKPWAL